MINKKEFSGKVAEYMHISKKDAEEFVNAFLDVTTDILISGEKIRFTGFGEFGTREQSPRTILNPLNGDQIKVPAKIKPYFKAGKNLKEAL